ncbi:hypothetical protein COT72_02835 [archaeon CG10_big_fil_rev_8_21_14_0_10_43_11]|nr:MAG: hypothetical protein COT72_02835 [archaeon CG10_big_fil_rev_8_21_14_0_10_43_11]
MPYVNGVYYKDTGKGRPMIFLSGLGGNHKNMETHAAYYRKKGYRTILIDFPVMGKSKKNALFSRALVRAVRNVVLKLGVSDIVLYAYSLGTSVALGYAKKYRGVSKMVLIGPGMAGTPLVRKQFFKILITYMKTSFPRISYTGLQYFRVKTFSSKNTPQQWIEDKVKETLKTPLWHVVWLLFLAKGCYYDVTGLGVPTILIGAETDHMNPKEEVLRIHKQLANSRTVFLKDCDHFLFYEKKDEILKRASAFLNQQ